MIFGFLPSRYNDPSYEQQVELLLNAERIRLRRIVDMADAVAIGNGDKKVPDSWIDLLEPNPVLRAKWKREEWRKDRG